MTDPVVLEDGDTALVLRKDGTFVIVHPGEPDEPACDTVVLAYGLALALENEGWAAALKRRTLEYITNDDDGPGRT